MKRIIIAILSPLESVVFWCLLVLALITWATVAAQH